MTTSVLSSAQLNAIHQATADAVGLPAQSYTSSEWMRSERDRVLAPTWTAIGYVNNLPLASATPVELMGLPLVIVKDPTATVRVFHNVVVIVGVSWWTRPVHFRAVFDARTTVGPTILMAR